MGAGMGEYSLHIKACHSIPSMAHHVGSMFECLSGLHGTGAHRAQVMQVLEGKTHNILLLHENCKERGGCEFARCTWCGSTPALPAAVPCVTSDFQDIQFIWPGLSYI